jgi:intracellular sulfur oxidation DsrE/DsrF family protein
MKPFVSDEALNAFVDGEFDVAESEAIIARMRDDPDLAQRVGTLRSLQSMVRLAYAEPPVSRGWVGRAVPRRQIMQRCAFGCLILLAGLSGGWGLRSLESQTVAVAPAAPVGVNSGYQTVSLAREADPNRVMLHIDSAAPDKMLAVLDQAERFLDEAEQQGRLMQLEVIANSHGLGLLRAGMSPYSDRIARMKKRHASLQFIACSQSIARFQHEGQKVVLLPAAQAAPTAIGEIITRLQQGWTYVRV